MTNEQLLTLMRFQYHLARMIAGQIAKRDEIVREAHLEASRCIDELKEECEPPLSSYWVLQHKTTKLFRTAWDDDEPRRPDYLPNASDDGTLRFDTMEEAAIYAQSINLWMLLEPYKFEAAPCP